LRLLHPGGNGATFKDCGGNADKDPSCGNCFAEYGMNGSNDNEDFDSCLIGTGLDVKLNQLDVKIEAKLDTVDSTIDIIKKDVKKMFNAHGFKIDTSFYDGRF